MRWETAAGLVAVAAAAGFIAGRETAPKGEERTVVETERETVTVHATEYVTRNVVRRAQEKVTFRKVAVPCRCGDAPAVVEERTVERMASSDVAESYGASMDTSRAASSDKSASESRAPERLRLSVMAGTWKGGDVSIGAAASVRVVGNVSLGAFVLADRHGDGTAGALVSVGF